MLQGWDNKCYRGPSSSQEMLICSDNSILFHFSHVQMRTIQAILEQGYFAYAYATWLEWLMHFSIPNNDHVHQLYHRAFMLCSISYKHSVAGCRCDKLWCQILAMDRHEHFSYSGIYSCQWEEHSLTKHSDIEYLLENLSDTEWNNSLASNKLPGVLLSLTSSHSEIPKYNNDTFRFVPCRDPPKCYRMTIQYNVGKQSIITRNKIPWVRPWD